MIIILFKLMLQKKEYNSTNLSIWHHSWYTLSSLQKNVIYLLKNHIKPNSNDIILDMGAGNCPYKEIFDSYQCKYITCDIDSKADIQLTERKEVQLPNKYADFIVSFQVLEHVWDLEWYLGNCHRLLKDKGKLILSTHGSWLYHPHPTDYRRWTKEGLIKELEEKGFKVEKVVGIVGPLALTTQYILLGIYYICNKLSILGSLILPVLSLPLNILMIFQDLITPYEIKDKNSCVYLAVCNKEILK